MDDYDRENEGDIVFSAEKASIETVVFTMMNARGLMCLPCTGEYLDRLEIPMMVKESSDRLQTPFTVSIDAVEGVSTGMSVHDRLKTISVFLDPKSKPSDLSRPGHLFPLRARDGLLKDRQGHTESSVELMKLAGLQPVAVICEIISDDGTMTKGEGLVEFAKKHNLPIISVQEIYDAVYNKSIQHASVQS